MGAPCVAPPPVPGSALLPWNRRCQWPPAIPGKKGLQNEEGPARLRLFPMQQKGRQGLCTAPSAVGSQGVPGCLGMSPQLGGLEEGGPMSLGTGPAEGIDRKSVV